MKIYKFHNYTLAMLKSILYNKRYPGGNVEFLMYQ